MATAATLAAFIGRRGVLAAGPRIRIQVRILDCRTNYSRTEYLVQPIAGYGQTWVTDSRLRIEEDTTRT